MGKDLHRVWTEKAANPYPGRGSGRVTHSHWLQLGSCNYDNDVLELPVIPSKGQEITSFCQSTRVPTNAHEFQISAEFQPYSTHPAFTDSCNGGGWKGTLEVTSTPPAPAFLVSSCQDSSVWLSVLVLTKTGNYSKFLLHLYLWKKFLPQEWNICIENVIFKVSCKHCFCWCQPQQHYKWSKKRKASTVWKNSVRWRPSFLLNSALFSF